MLFLVAMDMLSINAYDFKGNRVYLTQDPNIYETKNGISIRNLWLYDRFHYGVNELQSDFAWCNTKARTAVIQNGIVYIAHSEAKEIIAQSGDTEMAAVIYRYNALTGEELPALNVTLYGKPYTTFLGVNSIGKDNFGHVWVAPYTSEKTAEVPLYQVNVETGELTLVANLDKGDVIARTDYLDLVGDITLEQAECNVMTPGSQVSTVYAWHNEQGGDADTWEGFFNGATYMNFTEMFPETQTQWGYAPSCHFVLGENEAERYNGDNFYIDGYSTVPTLYAKDGTIIDGFGNLSQEEMLADSLLMPKTGNNGIAKFNLGERNFIVYPIAEYRAPNSCQVNICELGDGMTFSGMQRYWTLPADGQGQTSNNGLCIHPISIEYITIDEKEAVLVLEYKCYNGIGVYLVGIDSLVSSISLDPMIANIYIGDTITISASILPDNAYNTLFWTSSNPNVATVNQNGLVTANALGNATITATAKDGSGVSASCDVTVTGVESITINKTETSIYVGGTETLTATIAPSDVINNTLIWSSSDTNVATVDQNGLVTAKKLGTATITATATDGSGVSASCIVNVTGIENITFNKSETSIYVGGTETLTATITPSDVINKTLTWTSSNTTVATVDQSGKVTAKKLGTATITATATDGSGVSASCVVTVTGAESVILNKEEVSMYIGDTETLTATVYPDGLINKTLSWSSSKTSVATVDQNGLVIARAPGTATIRATATDGSGVSDSCVVNVVPEYTMSVDTLVHIRGTERVARTVDINLDNREAISGVQFDITLPNYVELATANGYPDMWLDDARKARNHSVDINLIGTKKYRVVVSSPTNKTFKGNEGAILHFNVLVDRFPSIGNATINLSNIVLAEADETQHTIGSVTSDVRFVYLVGDANADTRVDIADYVLTANKIMVRPVSNFWSDAANANYNDNTLNVTDLVAITNIALEMRGKEIRPAIDGFQFAPAVALPGIDIPLTARVVEMNADRTIVAIAIDNNEAIAAMQLDLDLPDGVMLESASVTDRSHMLSATCGTSPEGLPRVMLSSFGINDINAGCGDVLYLTLRGKARQGELMSLTNAVMSERNLIEHGASGNLTLDLNDYTGVSTVVYDHVNIYGENGSIIIESPVEGTAQLVRINGISREVKVEPGRNVYPVSAAHGDVIIAAFNGTTKKIQF